MLLFAWPAACRPAHAEALKDRSLRPPVSVTMQACTLVPLALAAGLAPPELFFAGGLPQAAAARTRPRTASPPTSLIPRACPRPISPPPRTADAGALDVRPRP